MPKKAQNPMGCIYGETLRHSSVAAPSAEWWPEKAKVFGLNIIGYDPYIMHPWLAKEKRYPVGEL